MSQVSEHRPFRLLETVYVNDPASQWHYRVGKIIEIDRGLAPYKVVFHFQDKDALWKTCSSWFPPDKLVVGGVAPQPEPAANIPETPDSSSPVARLGSCLSQGMQNDQDLAWTWHCNIVAASLDEDVDHETANRAAARFMSVAFGVDVTAFEEWSRFDWVKKPPQPSLAANVSDSPDGSVDHSADASKMVEPKIVARYDTEGRDVTELPGLWSEDDTQYREVIEGDLASGPIDCEVRNSDSEEWQPAVLCYIVHQSDRPFRVLKDRMEDSKGKWPYCRIKVAPVVKQSLTPDNTDPAKITIGYTVPNAYQADAEPITEPIQRKRVLYVAGPMRGIAFFNYPMFDRVAEILRKAGNEVISPADEDRKQDGFDPFANPKYADPDDCIFPKEMDFGKTVRRCLDAVLRCDEIVLLPGWEKSNGAVAELTLAMWLGKRVRNLRISDFGGFVWSCSWMGLAGLAYLLRDHHIPEVAAPAPVVVHDEDDDEDILDTAARITRGDRNASYGPPDQDFRRTAGMWSALFAAKLQDGETFEPRDVAMAMILLKCSRESHQRKLDNWVDIAGYARCGSKCN